MLAQALLMVIRHAYLVARFVVIRRPAQVVGDGEAPVKGQSVKVSGGPMGSS